MKRINIKIGFALIFLLSTYNCQFYIPKENYLLPDTATFTLSIKHFDTVILLNNTNYLDTNYLSWLAAKKIYANWKIRHAGSFLYELMKKISLLPPQQYNINTIYRELVIDTNYSLLKFTLYTTQTYSKALKHTLIYEYKNNRAELLEGYTQETYTQGYWLFRNKILNGEIDIKTYWKINDTLSYKIFTLVDSSGLEKDYLKIVIFNNDNLDYNIHIYNYNPYSKFLDTIQIKKHSNSGRIKSYKNFNDFNWHYWDY